MTRPLLLFSSIISLAFGCGSGTDVASTADAQRAYLGLDGSVDKAIQLGFQGFNTAGSANISPQTANGTVGGTLTVTGQVDQGNSANKGMRLYEAFVNYTDDGMLIYNASAGSSVELNMKLSGYTSTPGSLTGTLVKTVTMSGGLTGSVALNLSFTANTMWTASGSSGVVSRVTGTTHITGTATSPYGTYQVDVTR